jgi:diketogulonate reductase-like aldo/keto reductase
MIKNAKQILAKGFSSEAGAAVHFEPSKVVKRTLKMNDGNLIPQVGFGTYSIKKPEQFHWALQYGYRHFDTGNFYMNEGVLAGEIKKAEAELGIARSDVFVASKIPPKE